MDIREIWDWFVDGWHNLTGPVVTVRDVNTVAKHAGVPHMATQLEKAEAKLTKEHSRAASQEKSHKQGARTAGRKKRNARNGLRSVDRLKQHYGH